MKTLYSKVAPNNKSALDFFSMIINNLNDDELNVLFTHIKIKLTCFLHIYVINQDGSFVDEIHAELKDEYL